MIIWALNSGNGGSTTEGDALASKDTSGSSPLEFTFSSSYKKQVVQYNPNNGNYQIAMPWYPPDGVQTTKKAMVQPVWIICPDFAIADIEETEQNANNVDIVVFDDQTPNDYNNTVEPAGTCIINCTAKAFPKLTEDAREIVWNLLEWNLDDAGSVAPVYDDRNPENPYLQTIRYPDMPDHNDGFGPKTLALQFKDRPEWTAVHPLELRFNRDGTSAADQHHEQLENVAAGNPNWYVYWQQVADEFGFGPQADVMVYNDDETGDNDPEGTHGPTGFDNGIIQTEITLYDTCKSSIFGYVKILHHENGHQQSLELPHSQGGWGPGLVWDQGHDSDWDFIHDSWKADEGEKGYEEQGHGYTLGFRIGTNDRIRRGHWEHGWDSPEEAAAGDADGNYTNPDGYDPETARGLCRRNEDEVEEVRDEIEEHDWSYCPVNQ